MNNNTQNSGAQSPKKSTGTGVPVRKIPGASGTGGTGGRTAARPTGAAPSGTSRSSQSGARGASTTTPGGNARPKNPSGNRNGTSSGSGSSSGSITRTQTQTPSDNTSGSAGVLPENVRPYINKKTITLAVIIILVIINLIAFLRIRQTKIPEVMSPDAVKLASKIDIDKVFESPYGTAKVYSDDYQSGDLILVNGTHAFKDSYKGKDIPSPSLVQVNKLIRDKSFKARDNTTQLTPIMVEALNLMLADYVAEGGSRDVMVNEAYRTHEAQQNIYDTYIKRYGPDQQLALKPGYSEHHTGYAVDLSIYPDGGKGAKTFLREERNEWIYENCHKYGIIHRYAENKTEITGVAPESWHFRYVGVPHSTYMYERGITLEEYLSEIRIYTESIPLKVVANGEEYGVYYVEAEPLEYTEFNVPKNTEYKISGDNLGGFVVWYKTGETDTDED